MIVMMIKRNRTAPLILCDHCQERITDPQRSLACWDDPKGEDLPTPVFHLHKGDCDSGFNKGQHRPWQEMSTHLVYLTHNTGLPAEKIIEANQNALELEDFS